MGKNEEREPAEMSRLRQWTARSADKLLVKFKASDEGRAEVQELVRSPRTWLKGEYLVFGKLAPWEKLLFAIGAFTNTVTDQLDGTGRLQRYTFNVNPNWISVSDVVTRLWDAFNDPFIGTWMDRHPMQDNTYRWLVRANRIIGRFLTFFFMLDLGLSPMTRMVLYTVLRCVRDLIGTMDQVAYAKYYAGITPSSDERGKTVVWEGVANQLGYPIANIPAYIMGFARDRQRMSDYKVFTRGYVIGFPLMLCAGLANTYARNRIQFGAAARTAQEGLQEDIDANEVILTEEGPKLSLREAFSVVKHNKFMIYTTIAHCFKVFTPGIDDYPMRRFMFPKRRILGMGEPQRAEGYLQLAKNITGLPITFLYPFLGVVCKWLGGPKRTLVFHSAGAMVCHALKYFVGWKTIPGLVTILLADTFFETMGPIGGYAEHVLNYEMLDYVEYKTGVRSESITMAFKSLVNKILAENVDTITGNLFQSWTGIHTIDLDDPDLVLPERYQRWVWPLATLVPLVDTGFELIARLAFPYKYGQNVEIEAVLKERRALAEEAKKEMAETT